MPAIRWQPIRSREGVLIWQPTWLTAVVLLFGAFSSGACGSSEPKKKPGPQPLALGILVAAHADYVYVDDGGLDVFAASKRGYQQLIDTLGPKDLVAVWSYDERDVHAVVPWTSDKAAAKAAVAMVTHHWSDEMTPPLYRGIYSVLKNVLRNSQANDAFPSRRALVVMSDGKDRYLDRGAKHLSRQLGRIGEALSLSGVGLYLVGMSLDTTEPLAHMATLAAQTGGHYQVVDVRSDDDVEEALLGLSVPLKTMTGVIGLDAPGP
jgi:hypothetical protein